MPQHRYALTPHDVVLYAALDGVSAHLDLCAREGCWDARCDALHDRLGRYGLGRN